MNETVYWDPGISLSARPIVYGESELRSIDKEPAFAFQPLSATTSMLVPVTRVHGAIASAVLSTQLGVMHRVAAFSSKPGLMSRFIAVAVRITAWGNCMGGGPNAACHYRTCSRWSR
jgi:hypothetical protein